MLSGETSVLDSPLLSHEALDTLKRLQHDSFPTSCSQRQNSDLAKVARPNGQGEGQKLSGGFRDEEGGDCSLPR